jgi:ABC-type branched-subunit amino acid transport system ATPase component
MSADVLLAVDEVHAGYQSGIDILQGLSLAVRPKSLTLVIGPNGAGKSTLLRAIFGFLKPHAGAIRFQDEEISVLDPFEVKARGIGYVPQEVNTFPHLTVEENLRMGGWIFRRDKPRLRRQMDRVYEIFPPLAERRRTRASELSGGQGRMLVDEPTAGLAPNLVDQVYGLLLTARQSIGSTILLVDQNIEQAVVHADHVYMVNLGRIKAEGPARDFPPERIAALIRECLLG